MAILSLFTTPPNKGHQTQTQKLSFFPNTEDREVEEDVF